jgi:hypothetical protein
MKLFSLKSDSKKSTFRSAFGAEGGAIFIIFYFRIYFLASRYLFTQELYTPVSALYDLEKLGIEF